MLFLNSSYCQKNCLQEDKPVIAAGIVNISDVPDHLLKQQAELLPTPPVMSPPQSKRNAEPVSTAAKIPARSSSVTSLSQSKKNTELVLTAVKASVRSSSVMSLPQPKRNAKPMLAAAKASARSPPVISSPQPKKNAKSASTVARASEKPLSIKSLNISLIEAALFTTLAKKKAHWIFAVSMRDIEKALQDKLIIDPANIMSILMFFQRKQLTHCRPIDRMITQFQ